MSTDNPSGIPPWIKILVLLLVAFIVITLMVVLDSPSDLPTHQVPPSTCSTPAVHS